MTSALFNDCSSASSHFRQLEISPMKLPLFHPTRPLPLTPSSAANRFRERDDRTVGPACQEGRLQNLLRWGELQVTPSESTSRACLCWSDGWGERKQSHITWMQLSCTGTVSVLLYTWVEIILTFGSKLQTHFSTFLDNLDQTNKNKLHTMILLVIGSHYKLLWGN